MDQHGDDMADDFSQDMADNWDQAEQMEQEATPGMNKVFAQGKFAKQEDEGGGEPEFPALDEEPIEEEPMDEDPLGDEMDADPALDEGGGDGGGDVASDLDAVQDAQDAVEDVAEATGSGSLDELEQDLMDVQELAGSLRAAADAAERAQLSDKEKRQMQKRERRTSMYPLASSNDAEAAIFGEDPGPLERETAPTRTRSRNRV